MLALGLRRVAMVAGTVAVAACGDAFTKADVADASTNLDAGGVDASIDAGAPDSPAAASYCSMQSPAPVFCDDFDNRSGSDPTTVQGAWTTETLGGPGSSATIDDARVDTPSLPNSLFTQTATPILSPTATVAMLSDQVGRLGTSHTLKASFDVFVGAYGGGPAPTSKDLATIFVATLGPISYAILLQTSTLGYFIEAGNPDGGAPATHTLSSGFTTSSWTSVTLQLRAPTALAPGHISITLSTGQLVVAALNEDLLIRDDVSLAAATVDLGLSVTLAPAPWAIRYDNVIFDVN